MTGALDATLEGSDAAGLLAAQSLEPFASDLCDGDVSNSIKVTGAFAPGVLCPCLLYTSRCV